MAVIETGRTCRRNGMANIFADIDAADIEYLSSLTASESTASVPNLTGAHALQISFEDPSLNTDDSGNHQSDDNNDEDSTDCRWRSVLVDCSEPNLSVPVFGSGLNSVIHAGTCLIVNHECVANWVILRRCPFGYKFYRLHSLARILATHATVRRSTTRYRPRLRQIR